MPFEGDDLLVRVSGAHKKYSAARPGHSLLDWPVLLHLRTSSPLAFSDSQEGGQANSRRAAETNRTGKATIESVPYSSGDASRLRTAQTEIFHPPFVRFLSLGLSLTFPKIIALSNRRP